ncbi:MAG: methionine synthase [SAR202 cluster bacterium]|nr:methionine synthase [SAR202 cluster bacterium]
MQVPLLPTSVIGSHAYPSWMWTALGEVDKGNYGQTDTGEMFDDAVDLAMMDQERAGVDIISDGEMRRWYFVQSFYKRMTGIVSEPALRKVGLYAYDSPPRYKAVEKVSVPKGLGIVEEFKYAKARTKRPIKVTCPGPLTLTMHIRPGDVYKSRLELAAEFSEVINDELKAVVAAGATYIQIDEPSFAVIPGEIDEWMSVYNRSVEGVNAKLALHVCFGNLSSRPRGKRRYDWLFPTLYKARADQMIFEYSNREMCEVELWETFKDKFELGAGVIDVKSFYVETAEDVAERIREHLKYGPADKLWIVPDCGFFQLPRWITKLKLKAMVEGTKIVRKELGG